MSVTMFLVLFAVGGAALALWIDVRFPKLAPAALRPALITVGISVLAAQLLVPPALQYLLGTGSWPLSLVGLFCLALPTLTFTFLAAIWVIKIFRGTLTGLHH
jgi:hypothetical protein